MASLALALFSMHLMAAAGPAADPAPGAVCPNGDTPTGVLEELVHVGRARALDVADGRGVLTFTDVVENRMAGPAQITVALGVGGVVRAASVQQQGEAPRAAHLDDAETAAALLEEYKTALTMGVPAGEARDTAARAAILVTHAGPREEPSVTVLVPCSIRSVTVRVEMLLPSVPVDGAWRFALPGFGPEKGPDTLVVDSARPIRAFLEDDVLTPGHAVAVPALGDGDEDGELTVTVRPLGGPRLRARGFAVHLAPTPAPTPPPELHAGDATDDAGATDATGAAGDDASEDDDVSPVVVARAELDLPRPLATAPAGLRFVFVVDNSVSVRDAGVAKALQIVDAILDEAPPDARFAVVTAGRRPRVVVPPWTPRDARDFPAIEVENGSDVLAALKKARAIASDLRRAEGDEGGEVARIIAISDMRLRFIDTDARVAGGFGGAEAPVTHVVTVADGDVEQPLYWTRSFVDVDARAAGPESTGGIWVDVGDEEERALFSHLVAPTRLDRPRVTLGGVDVLPGALALRIDPSPIDTAPQPEDELPALLPAGSGLRVAVALAEGHAAFGRRDLRVGGLLWASPLDVRVTNDEGLLGLAAVDAIGAALEDDVVRTLARRAHAVSRVTSLVEVPAFRPAEPELGGMYGYGCGCGCGCMGTMDRGFSASTSCPGVAVDLRERETLEALLREDARACLVPRAILDVEFEDHELLDVQERAGGTCVAERFWRRRLDQTAREPGAFVSHREMTIGVDGP